MTTYFVFPASYRLRARWRRRKDGFTVDVLHSPCKRVNVCRVERQGDMPSGLTRTFYTEQAAAQWARKTAQAGPEAIRHLTMEIGHGR